MKNAPSGFIAAAMRSEDGKTLQLAAVNPGDEPIDAAIKVEGFDLQNAVAQVSQLAAPLDAVNTALKPDEVAPRRSEWRHLKTQGETRRVFAPRSFTIIRWE